MHEDDGRLNCGNTGGVMVKEKVNVKVVIICGSYFFFFFLFFGCCSPFRFVFCPFFLDLDLISLLDVVRELACFLGNVCGWVDGCDGCGMWHLMLSG